MRRRYLTFGWVAPDGQEFYQYENYSGINHDALIRAIAIENFKKFGEDRYTELLHLFREYGASRFALHKGWVRWGFNQYINNQMCYIVEGGADTINNSKIIKALEDILIQGLEDYSISHVVVDFLNPEDFRSLLDSQILLVSDFLEL